MICPSSESLSGVSSTASLRYSAPRASPTEPAGSSKMSVVAVKSMLLRVEMAVRLVLAFTGSRLLGVVPKGLTSPLSIASISASRLM